jgi:type VI secretion system secreted protein Hcp
MAFDAFMKIDGISGECLDDRHKGWIEITCYTHKMEQPASASASSSGGATAERVNHGLFHVVHLLDKASPKIYEACCKGTHIKDVIILLYRAGGEKEKYAEIKMEQVLIAGVDMAGGGDFPAETISFSYGKIAWTYIQQRREDGTGGGSVASGWDLTANKAFA